MSQYMTTNYYFENHLLMKTSWLVFPYNFLVHYRYLLDLKVIKVYAKNILHKNFKWNEEEKFNQQTK